MKQELIQRTFQAMSSPVGAANAYHYLEQLALMGAIEWADKEFWINGLPPVKASRKRAK